MKYEVDHDFHIHSTISPCCHDENQTPETILNYAKENNFKAVCLTNHLWDESVKSVDVWHPEQRFDFITKALPLPQDEKVKFLFGAEAEMDYNYTLGVSDEHIDCFDFITVSTTHLHLEGYTVKKRPQIPEEAAELWLKRFEELLKKDLPWHKMVGAEIDRQIITEMVKAAITGGSVCTWSPVSADGLDQMGRLATLLTQITVEANQIAIKTRRGNANFVVTTPRVCALLQQLSMNKFTSFKNTDAIPTVPDTGVGALAKVGLINDDQQLLVRDSYAATGAMDYVLMGYKGKQSGDSGIIYMPYIPLQLSKVIQPGSFTPSVGARTRYGIMSSPWDAKNFYTFMKITDVSTGYNFNETKRVFVAPVADITNGTVFKQEA